MKRIKYFCDICEEELTFDNDLENFSSFDVLVKSGFKYHIELKTEAHVDVCAKCCQKLKKELREALVVEDVYEGLYS